jgi:hypothetical protein
MVDSCLGASVDLVHVVRGGGDYTTPVVMLSMADVAAERRSRARQVQSPLVVPNYFPMAATLVRERFHRDGWVYEEKL